MTVKLLDNGFSVVGIDNFCEELYSSTTRRDEMSKIQHQANFEFINADLLDLDLDVLEECDVVLNFAGLAGQARSWEIPRRYRELNVDLAVKLYEAALRNGARKFVHASSSSVYGEISVGDESQPFNPCSPYGETKVEAEIALGEASNGACDLAILRFFSVYGPGQRTDMGFFRIIKSALAGEEVPVHDRPGLMRDFTYVSDVVEAVIAVIDPKVGTEIFNVASSKPTSLEEALDVIEELTNGNMRRRLIETPTGLQTISSGDTTRLRRATLWRPSTSLRDGLEKQVSWQKSFSIS